METNIVGNRKATVLKLKNQWVQIILLNSAWVDAYHFIIEEIEGMTALKTEHKILSKQELIKELNNDVKLVTKLIDEL